MMTLLANNVIPRVYNKLLMTLDLRTEADQSLTDKEIIYSRYRMRTWSRIMSPIFPASALINWPVIEFDQEWNRVYNQSFL